ncbi:MAG TPA: DNA-formamidopyrimidine glycosylase family protein [Polyangia bacterium]|jgi:formamidopyrimidine-DNA glycosylase|nr:DNA-formamidopyrimidine glycosylase family protein [Polyangia bacterium]
MPELPDVTVYVERVGERVIGQTLERVRLASPFLLRSVAPPLSSVDGKRVLGLERLGKRIVFALADDYFLVLHLMVAGRLKWPGQKAVKIPGKVGLAAFDFSSGTLILTEASSKKRASLHVVQGRAGLAEHDRGGLEPLGATKQAFREVIQRENHTIKRTLTDPRLFSGIGNAYSDEILHRAKLSPVVLTSRLGEPEIARLQAATESLLREWTDKLRAESATKFPEKVTAFRDDFAVHGKYRQPCPVCKKPVQRIRYAENETNYCATCQTGGKLLADRGLSRLLHGDWPKSLDEMDERKASARAEMIGDADD